MRGRAVTLVLALGAAGPGPAPGLTAQEDPFPHARHEGLFPLCTGCHAGVSAGDQARFYPDPSSCNGCHDGVEARRVSWAPPEPEVDNVRFAHDQHAARLATEGDPAQACEACHTAGGGPRMTVTAEVQLGTCWSCHAHRAEEHVVDARCETCHVPIAESGFDVERLAALPVPSDHEPALFHSDKHGRLAETGLARCATCHTQERCVACHVDAERATIRGLAAAPPDMRLPPAVAHYNEPVSHVDDGWLAGHGSQASRRACATCHTSDDCRACHVSPAPEVVASLPARADVVAPGVGLAPREPESHRSVFFFKEHGTLAASGATTCGSCHQERYCVGCHDAPSGGGYHPLNFVAGHAAQAFGRDVECASCHSTQVFCRACHVDAGLTGFARTGPPYHDSQPLWLIRHGQSARQSLESCASCHAQADCTRCHGPLGAFKVSPHSRDFDARRAFARNPRPCFFCHIGNPFNGSDR